MTQQNEKSFNAFVLVDIINISTSRRQEPAPDLIRGRRRKAVSKARLR